MSFTSVPVTPKPRPSACNASFMGDMLNFLLKNESDLHTLLLDCWDMSLKVPVFQPATFQPATKDESGTLLTQPAVRSMSLLDVMEESPWVTEEHALRLLTRDRLFRKTQACFSPHLRVVSSDAVVEYEADPWTRALAMAVRRDWSKALQTWLDMRVRPKKEHLRAYLLPALTRPGDSTSKVFPCEPALMTARCAPATFHPEEAPPSSDRRTPLMGDVVRTLLHTPSPLQDAFLDRWDFSVKVPVLQRQAFLFKKKVKNKYIRMMSLLDLLEESPWVTEEDALRLITPDRVLQEKQGCYRRSVKAAYTCSLEPLKKEGARVVPCDPDPWLHVLSLALRRGWTRAAHAWLAWPVREKSRRLLGGLNDLHNRLGSTPLVLEALLVKSPLSQEARTAWWKALMEEGGLKYAYGRNDLVKTGKVIGEHERSAEWLQRAEALVPLWSSAVEQEAWKATWFKRGEAESWYDHLCAADPGRALSWIRIRLNKVLYRINQNLQVDTCHEEVVDVSRLRRRFYSKDTKCSLEEKKARASALQIMRHTQGLHAAHGVPLSRQTWIALLIIMNAEGLTLKDALRSKLPSHAFPASVTELCLLVSVLNASRLPDRTFFIHRLETALPCDRGRLWYKVFEGCERTRDGWIDGTLPVTRQKLMTYVALERHLQRSPSFVETRLSILQYPRDAWTPEFRGFFDTWVIERALSEKESTASRTLPSSSPTVHKASPPSHPESEESVLPSKIRRRL